MITPFDLTPAMPGPPLPAPLASPQSPAAIELQPPSGPVGPHPRFRSLSCGCYLASYRPTSSALVAFDGTIRVECHPDGRTASGDLYQRRTRITGFPPRPIHDRPPNPADGIPVLARAQYRFYLRITQILENLTLTNRFTLGFEMWRFTKAVGGWSAGGTWSHEGSFTADMTWITAPAGYPSPRDYLEGDVKNGAGAVVGRLKMGWVSRYLRRATIEIDRVDASEAPVNNGAGVDWRNVGDSIGWDISVFESNSDLTEPSGEFWSNAECHSAMLAKRDQSNLDKEWRYHILCIRRLDATERGIMYDNGASDSNNVPREGCACSTHWTMPDTPEWGLVRNQRFGSVATVYFRTAVHETGHAMGLYHNTIDNGFMNTTDVISSSATPARPFPTNIQWTHAPDDQMRLRHMPDIYVRPGGTPFGTSYASTPVSPADFSAEVEGLQLLVTPLLEAVPIGAPVRVNIKLANHGGEPAEVPAGINLKSGFVKGIVVGPTGRARPFSPLVLCLDEERMRTLMPGESMEDSLTLLRGGEGPLFPAGGPHRIVVQVSWDVGGAEVLVSGQTEIMVTAATDEAHAKAALDILTTPDTLLTLVLGGDHLKDGIEAINGALVNSTLRPHFAFIEAKRLAERFGKRKANLKAASDLIDDDAVLSPAEIKKAAKLVSAAGAENASAKSIAKVLKGNLIKQNVNDEVSNMVTAL